MVQKKEVTETRRPSGVGTYEEQVDYISGWILNFFAYFGEKSHFSKRVKPFTESELRVENFKKLANQMSIVPFTIKDLVHNKEYLMKYKVGFVGCDQNEKNEVYPVQEWLVSPSSKEESNSKL